MLNLIVRLFDPTGFPPRWHCGGWSVAHGWLHILSDLGIWSAYFTIPVVLWYFARRRADLPFRHLLWLFGAFILLCGTTHLIEAVIFWMPIYRLAGVLKLATAITSWVTVAALIWVTPRMLEMRSPEALEQEIAARRAAEDAHSRALATLSKTVQALTAANSAIQTERERYRMVLEDQAEVVSRFRIDGTFTFVNQAFCRTFGKDPSQHIGESWTPCAHAEDIPRVEEALSRLTFDQPVVRIENRVYDAAGRVRWMEFHNRGFFDSDGRLSEVQSVGRDVTDRKLAEERLRESEERYRLLFHQSPLPMWVLDEERLAFLEVNPAAIAKYGYSRTAFLGLTPNEIQSVFCQSDLVNEWDSGMLDCARVRRHRLKDGSEIQVRVAVHPLTYGDRPAQLVQVFDVSDQLRVEEELRTSEAKLRSLFESPLFGAFYWDVSGGIEDANDGLLKMLGYSRTDMEVGLLNWRQLTPDEYSPNDQRAVDELLAGAAACTPFEKEYFRKDGSRVPILLSAALLPNSRQRGVCYIIDLTARRKAELARQEGENRYRSLFTALSEGVAFVAPNMTILECNASAERILGLPPGGLCGRASDDPGWGAVHEDGTPFRAEDLPTRVTMRTGQPCENVVIGVHKPDGTQGWISLNAEPLTRISDTSPYGVACSFTDITERKLAADALRSANELYRLLADHISDVVVLLTVDNQGNYVRKYISPSCLHLTGYSAENLQDTSLWELFHPDDIARSKEFFAAAAAGKKSSVLWRCRHRDGHYVWVESLLTSVAGTGGIAQIVATSRDVTDRRAAEERLRQAQKLEAIGQLAGGVAHDFNNLLTVVNGCGELLLKDLPINSTARPLAELIINAGKRGADLTRQLLAFSRQQMFRVEVFDLSSLLPETAKLLVRLLGEDIVIRLDLDPAAGCVTADVSQIEQVVLNLAVNARDAMPLGGNIVIQTAAVDLGEGDRLPSPDAQPGRYVRLTVSDSGTGIPPDVQARLFEPFYTTKPAGKGTGLGLATVYGIVRQSGGFITVDSEVGRGSTFAVFLPWYEVKEETTIPTSVPSPKAAGSETVLLVEDDESVRRLAKEILARQGYRVEEAADGLAALAACESLHAAPDVLLTDVVMPGMSGRELAEKLTARYPNMRVAYLSGYTADEVLRCGVEDDRVSFIPKPYTPDSLARFVRELLDQPVQ